MKAAEFTELHFIAEALVAAPERLQYIYDSVIYDTRTPKAVRQCVTRIYEFVVASEYIETDAKLWDAAEQLVRSTDELDVQAGAALSSRLLNARRPLRARPQERTPLTTNRLAERYRLAFQRRRE